MRFRVVIKEKTFEDLIKSDLTWEDSEDSLYEDLYASKFDKEYKSLEEEWKKEPFKIGDIIMVNKSSSSSNGSNFTIPHRIYVITSVDLKDGTHLYRGFELSSKTDTSNKIWLENNPDKKISNVIKRRIYINNYSTILNDGVPTNKECLIDLGTAYSFTNKDLSDTGVKKGEANKEFSDFVKETVNKINSGEDTSRIYWIK